MTGPFTIPRFDFSATAGVGDFTSTVLTSNPQGAVTVMVTYKGKEISRTFMPEPGGVAMLIPGLLLLTGLTTAHRRRAR
jgi:hypothetical protein